MKLLVILFAILLPTAVGAEVQVSISGGAKIKDGDSGGQHVVAVDAQVKIPFDEEYKINLDNRDSSRRALVHVKIDGRAATGEGLVLRKGESVALERFIGDDLKRGPKFKFVDQDEQKRMGRAESMHDGLIAVTVQYEKDTSPLVKYEQQSFSGSGIIRFGQIPYATDAIATLSTAATVTSGSITSPEPGVTVEGSESKQRFKETKLSELENRVETLVIRLLGYYKQAPLLMRQR